MSPYHSAKSAINRVTCLGQSLSLGLGNEVVSLLKNNQARMIQISEGAALTPQEWQNLAINSVHHEDTQEKNKTKNQKKTP